MESYLEHTQAYLSMIKETLTAEELKKCQEAGNEIYDTIAELVEKHNLNIKEMLFTTFAIHHTILEVSIEELSKQVEENEE